MPHDLAEVKAAASGMWPAILNRVAGIDDDYMRRGHGPCPKCGGGPGADRFRCFDDFEQSGGMVCNQCGIKNGKMADGFAVIEWMLGCKFPEALKLVGEFLGVPEKKKFAAKGKPKKRKIELEFLEGQESCLVWFCHSKNISIQAAKRLGVQVARYKNQHIVAAFPLVGDEGKTVGHTLYGAYGGKLPLWNGKEKSTEWKKVLSVKF